MCYSSVREQHGWEAALGEAPLWLDSSALAQSGPLPSGLLLLLCPTLVLRDSFDVLAPAEEMQSSVFSGMGKCAPVVRGEMTHTERSPHP